MLTRFKEAEMIRPGWEVPVLLAGFLACLGLPTVPFAPSLLKGPLTAYLVCPALILTVSRRNPVRCGLGLGDWRKGIALSIPLAAGILVTTCLLAHMAVFQSYYAHGAARWAAGSQKIVVLAAWKELRLMTGWEFLFRGFLLFPLSSRLGPPANLVQATLCAVTHHGKPWPEFYGSFPFALVLGLLARKTRSIWYGVFLHWLLSFSLEAFIAIAKYGVGPVL